MRRDDTSEGHAFHRNSFTRWEVCVRLDSVGTSYSRSFYSSNKCQVSFLMSKECINSLLVEREILPYAGSARSEALHE